MNKILVIEDDKEINNLICEFLGENGYETISANDGITGLRKFANEKNISLVILDLMLPYKSGDRVLSEIRKTSNIPVIVTSAKDMIQTKVDIMRLGADDYITKPFDLDELLVRIEVVLRRCNRTIYMNTAENNICHGTGAGGTAPQNITTSSGMTGIRGEIYTFKNLTLDDDLKEARVNDHVLELTAKEYEILRLLVTNPRKLFSKANLYESVWNEPYYAEDNTLKVHVSNIRNKIKKYDSEEYIETVWGMGYKIKTSNK